MLDVAVQPLGGRQGSGKSNDACNLRLSAQSGVERRRGALRKPGECQAGVVELAAGQQFIEKAIENCAGFPQAGEQFFRRAVSQAEPLPGDRRISDGNGAFGAMNSASGKIFRQARASEMRSLPLAATPCRRTTDKPPCRRKAARAPARRVVLASVLPTDRLSDFRGFGDWAKRSSYLLAGIPRNVLGEPPRSKNPALSRRVEETQRPARTCSARFKLA